MDLTQQLLNRAFELIQDPRVAKVLQHPRVMQGVMGAVQLGARVQTNWNASVKAVAEGLNLATGTDVDELRRSIRRLEQQLLEQQLNTRQREPGDRAQERASLGSTEHAPWRNDPESRP